MSVLIIPLIIFGLIVLLEYLGILETMILAFMVIIINVFGA